MVNFTELSRKLDDTQKRPLVVGIDRHSSDDFLIATNPDDFPGSRSIDFELRNNYNDSANIIIAKVLDHFGMECLFSSSIKQVQQVVTRDVCKVLLLHPHLEDCALLPSLVENRKDLIKVLLYADSFSLETFPIVSKGGQVHQIDDELLGVNKVGGIVDMAEYLAILLGLPIDDKETDTSFLK